MYMTSFVDEYLKIAASSKSAPSPKTRIGKRPIRVENLLKKADAKKEVAKKTVGGLKGFLSRTGKKVWDKKKPIALVGGGAVGAKAGEEYLVEPWQYGRKAKAMGAQF